MSFHVLVVHVSRVAYHLSPGYATSVVHDGNITLDQVIEIARTMRERSLARAERASSLHESSFQRFSESHAELLRERRQG